MVKWLRPHQYNMGTPVSNVLDGIFSVSYTYSVSGGFLPQVNTTLNGDVRIGTASTSYSLILNGVQVTTSGGGGGGGGISNASGWSLYPAINTVNVGNNALNVSGFTTLNGLNVSGPATLNGLDVSGATTLNTLNVSGITTLNGLNVSGATTLSGTLTLNGVAITGASSTISDWSLYPAYNNVNFLGNSISNVASVNDLYLNGSAGISIGPNAGIPNGGTDNIFMGNTAGSSNTASNVIAIGNQAGFNNTGNNSIFLGKNPNPAIVNASSNQFIVYSTNASVPLIRGDMATNDITFGNNITVNGAVRSANLATALIDVSAGGFMFTIPLLAASSSISLNYILPPTSPYEGNVIVLGPYSQISMSNVANSQSLNQNNQGSTPYTVPGSSTSPIWFGGFDNITYSLTGV